jgi:DNA invertase Pin-like site-specific DNA recombinase
MSKPRRIAVSYSRFSAPAQATGDSEDRQARLFKQFCDFHNLTPLSEVFADRGRSGYKDEHRKKGRLGQLIAYAKDGRFETGTIIVVEAWDRLGRLRPDNQTELVKELLRNGVGIGICRLNDIFTEDDFGSHKWITLAVFIQLAYQESKQKAERLAASWESRRRKARENGRLVTTTLPAWLEVIHGKPRLIPERAAVVKRIFQLAADGFGHTRIIKTLVSEKVPPFGTKKWTKPYLDLILNDGRALGEFHPKKLDGSTDGQPIAGYFPAVVTQEEYLLARQGQEKRLGMDNKGRVLSARQVTYANVFKGLLKHARDAEGFVLHNKGTAKEPRLLLKNLGGESGRHPCYTFPYDVFETAVLSLLREVNSAEVLPKDEPPSEVEVLRTKLAAIRSDIAGLQADLKTSYSKAIAAVLRDREAVEVQLTSELQDQLARDARPLHAAWEQLPSLVDLIAEKGDEARLKLRTVLRRVIAEAWVLIVPRGSLRLASVQFFFSEGARRDYLILYQLATKKHPGGWQACSLATVAKDNELDLRRHRDAAALEKLLLAVDVARLAERMSP